MWTTKSAESTRALLKDHRDEKSDPLVSFILNDSSNLLKDTLPVSPGLWPFL